MYLSNNSIYYGLLLHIYGIMLYRRKSDLISALQLEEKSVILRD